MHSHPSKPVETSDIALYFSFVQGIRQDFDRSFTSGLSCSRNASQALASDSILSWEPIDVELDRLEHRTPGRGASPVRYCRSQSSLTALSFCPKWIVVYQPYLPTRLCFFVSLTQSVGGSIVGTKMPYRHLVGIYLGQTQTPLNFWIIHRPRISSIYQAGIGQVTFGFFANTWIRERANRLWHQHQGLSVQLSNSLGIGNQFKSFTTVQVGKAVTATYIQYRTVFETLAVGVKAVHQFRLPLNIGKRGLAVITATRLVPTRSKLLFVPAWYACRRIPAPKSNTLISCVFDTSG